MAFNSDIPLQTNQLPISIDFPRDERLFLETLTDTYKRIANVVNLKEGSLYNLTELANFRQYYRLPTATVSVQTFRNGYRKVFDIIQLNSNIPIGPGAMVSFPHNITGLANADLIYAGCTNTVPEYFTCVYPNVKLTATNVVFTNPDGVNALTQVMVVANYMKQTP